jgi:uroporphyrin-III C-methyltransferase
MAEAGQVVLVGGGPGADDLITVRGLDRLMAADVVVTDRLAPSGLLARLGSHVEIIDAARTPASRTLSHDQIVRLMIDRARDGKTVVRLKGGDPFVFAHGAQEVAACTEAGVPVEVVPGVSSATAAAAFATVPLTGAEGGTGFSVVSGHVAPDDPANRVDWSALSRSGTNIVVVMGMRHLAAIARRLIAEGVSPDAPATCIADASLATERVVRTGLADLAAAVATAGLSNPATVIVQAGDVRASRRVLVLGGSRSGKSGHAERLAAAGAPVIYVATAAGDPEDQEWADRIDRHRRRRPADWTTLESRDLVPLLGRDGTGTLLVDSITAWLSTVMDDCGCWAEPHDPAVDRRLAGAVDDLVAAWTTAASGVVAVSDEVGGGIVPATASGRRFRDELGDLNQRLAAAADEVWLVTAGIASRLR